ncbi:MAG: site-2 protease family protein [Oscillospiraceae bacterium]|nr:site-2 protease family protein [Oscillospiraceae bacterium]
MITNFLFGSMSRIDFLIWIFSICAIIFVLFPIHEGAHALAAKLLGDDTAERQGRLTLNPIPHIDPFGALFMFLVGFGWAKPVPVDARNATRKVTMRGFISLTAAAGPVSNILFSLFLIIVVKVVGVMSAASTGDLLYLFYIQAALVMTAQISIYLAVFNLIPIPPLDGSKILFFFLNNKQVYFLEKNMHIIRIALFLLILAPAPFNVVGRLIRQVSHFVLLGLDYATFFIK